MKRKDSSWRLRESKQSTLSIFILSFSSFKNFYARLELLVREHVGAGDIVVACAFVATASHSSLGDDDDASPPRRCRNSASTLPSTKCDTTTTTKNGCPPVLALFFLVGSIAQRAHAMARQAYTVKKGFH